MDNYFKKNMEIDVSSKITKKGNFDYLPWAEAVNYLLSSDPMASWRFDESRIIGDTKTVMVFCSVKMNGIERTAHLAVLDFKNNPIENPNAADIADTMQRALVKAIALHGIGLSLWMKEEKTPDTSYQPQQKQTPKIDQKTFHKEIPNSADVLLKPKTSDGDEYIVNFGKYNGKKLSEMSQEQIYSYKKWLLDDEKKKGKEMNQSAKDFCLAADHYLKACEVINSSVF